MYAALTYFGQGKLICTSTTTADNGKTVSVTDGKKTWTGVMTNGVCTFTLPAKQKYTIKLLNGGTVEYETEVIYGFGECKEIEVGMDKKSWKGLKAILNAGLEGEMLAVGDQISATVAGKSQLFDIVHINYRTDLYGRNLILAAHYCMDEKKPYNSNGYNNGGFRGSTLAAYLNNDYYNSLPADVRSVITEMTFKANMGGKQNPLQDETHKIWAPLTYNIFGAAHYASPAESDPNQGGAQQFDYFIDYTKRNKSTANGTASYWWCSSPYYQNNTHVMAVSVNAESIYHTAETMLSVAPFFMIAADAE